MLKQIVFTCISFFALSTVGIAQYQEFYYNESMEGQSPFLSEPAGLEDPSFEFPFASRPRQDKIFVSKDFETVDFSAVQSLTRTWVGTPDEERVLGRKFLRINGTGGLANWFPIRPSYEDPNFVLGGPSLGHYVTVRAKQDGPFEAIFGINYFDSKWNLIQKNSALISGSELGVSRGDGDLLKKYTIPTHVPYGAAFGQVWIAAPFANGTTTFDFLNVFTEARLAANDWANPFSNLLRNSSLFVGDFDYHKTGYEFWNAIPGSEAGVKVDYWVPESPQKSLLLGQPGRITNIYQVIDVLPNQPYAVNMVSEPRANLNLVNARGWFGIDFFDSNAKKIDQVVFDITQGQDIDNAIYNPVPNVDFAIAWFYVEPLFRDEVLPIFGVEIAISNGIVATAKLASATATTGTGSAKVAPKHSKRPVPSSPITPAMALQAKKSLPAASVTPVVSKTTTTKPAPKK